VEKACIGCGYCCRAAPCVRKPYTQECVYLSFDGKRYWCERCRLPGEEGRKHREDLSVGAGCCSPLNSDRRKMLTGEPEDCD
jgi:hypothetical protein